MKTPFPKLKLGNNFLQNIYSECFGKLAEEMCKDGIADSVYDNIYNAICRWSVINCTRLRI